MGHDNIRTFLDFSREREVRRLLGDIELLMYAPASTQGTPYTIKTSINPSWKMGKLFLEPERLFFLQGNSELFEVPIKKIKQVYIVQRKWLGKKTGDQLCIVINGYSPFHIAVMDPQTWKEAIENLLMVNAEVAGNG